MLLSINLSFMDMIIKYAVKSVLCISSAYNKGVGTLLTFSETRVYIINEHSKQEHSTNNDISYFTNI